MYKNNKELNMQNLTIKLTLCLTLITGSFMAYADETTDKADFLKITPFYSYESNYIYRGIELNSGCGVNWLGVTAVFGETGISAVVYTGLNSGYIFANDSDTRKSIEDTTELDYNILYSKTFADLINVGASLLFTQYPTNSDLNIAEGGISFGIKTLLNPTINVYYDYLIKKPAADIYSNLTISHEIFNAENFIITAGAWLGYYNLATSDISGLSDIGIKLETSKTINNVGIISGLYYVYTIEKDLQALSTVSKKNHIWGKVGASYTF